MRNSDDYYYQYKIVIKGDKGVGKTNIINQYTQGIFQEVRTSICQEIPEKNLVIDNDFIKVQLWDTSEMARFQAIYKTYYKGAAGVLIVFDITQQSSFDHMDQMIKYVKEITQNDIPIAMAGNKSDLENLREVSFDVSSAYASNNKISFLETSAKLGSNVHQVLDKFIHEIHRKNKNNPQYIRKNFEQQINKGIQVQKQSHSLCW